MPSSAVSVTRQILQKLSLGLGLCLFLLAFSYSHAQAASNERIANLSVRVNDGKILVSADLIRGFSKTTKEDLLNGIPKDLYYYVVLKKHQALWFDEEAYSKTIRFTIKYDLLKKQFLIKKRLDTHTQEEVVDTFVAMKQLISRIRDVRIADTQRLAPRLTYLVSVKAEMKAPELPFYLDYLLFFIPFLEVDTPWAHSGPIYRD